MKVDLCMWAKDGARYLPHVLRRIDEVIPDKSVNKRIFVDDSSRDATVEIARGFGWDVYKNVEGFVSGGAREALRHVESEFFVSVEQDVLLARDWWEKIPKYMDDPKVLVAQGIRVHTHPTLRCLAEYTYGDRRHLMGYSLDNNIFRAGLLRKLGGFSKEEPIFVDTELRDRISKTEYKWVVDESVVSYHIREGILGTMRHGYKQAMLSKRDRWSGVSFFNVLRSATTSPARGLHIALKKRHPKAFLAYPLIRLMELKTFIHYGRPKKWHRLNLSPQIKGKAKSRRQINRN